jgi:hypothetical protein
VHTLNLSLTDELRALIDSNCGDGTLYVTPSEFVSDLRRQRKAQLEAAAVPRGHSRRLPRRRRGPHSGVPGQPARPLEESA